MAHISPEILRKQLQEARETVMMQGVYRHYKHPEHTYTVIDVLILEETDSVGVVYRSEYGDSKGLVFVRPLDSFCETVAIGQDCVPRFSLVR